MERSLVRRNLKKDEERPEECDLRIFSWLLTVRYNFVDVIQLHAAYCHGTRKTIMVIAVHQNSNRATWNYVLFPWKQTTIRQSPHQNALLQTNKPFFCIVPGIPNQNRVFTGLDFFLSPTAESSCGSCCSPWLRGVAGMSCRDVNQTRTPLQLPFLFFETSDSMFGSRGRPKIICPIPSWRCLYAAIHVCLCSTFCYQAKILLTSRSAGTYSQAISP